MSLRSTLRDARYALPGLVGRHLHGPGTAEAASLTLRLARRGLGATHGYFPPDGATPDHVEAANLALIAALGGQPAQLALKAPHLAFDRARIAAILRAAQAAGVGITLDSHGPALADATLALVEDFPGIGCALPARWLRSMGDARRLYATSARLRIVKGEWADPAADAADPAAAFLALVRSLAGRAAPVAVATHDPALARRALGLLAQAGTPCELEQLRGLPRARSMAAARELGVPVRLYAPFGPGWWPYAIDKALARPHLPLWALRDWLGLAD